ncbi:MAG TPA: hypothetical protein RMH99_01305 [Sandaracinaceae bacterium LLY-WYZ-13_1]|nr:hypothetical protein [Sandaracinaceae bacterium LLY-WYZ-13_1]
MTLVDQFESVFRSADRRRYKYTWVDVREVLVVTDLEATEAQGFTDNLKRFLVELGEDVTWTTLENEDYGDVEALVAKVDELQPDLIVSYRNVRYSTWKWPYSLGVYLNVLTRETDYPVMVMPNPHERPDMSWAKYETDTVMVLADHLTGDDRLVDYGARFTRPSGKLYLTHVEDDAVFDRYIEVISKLPSIDTDIAREDIRERLLKEPRDYVATCREVLAEQGHLTHEVIPVVVMGHRLGDYVKLIEDHDVDLLVFHTKEEDDLALHGKAYSLAVQIRDIPILML